MVHNFTNEQMFKFLQVLGASAEVPGGQYTTGQLKDIAEKNGGLNEFPSITDDPKVNFAVDCVVDEETEYDPKFYEEEVQAFREIGAFA